MSNQRSHDDRSLHIPSKRRRVAIACTPCRRRKTRCNGGRPICSFCAEYDLPCSYDQPPPPSIVTSSETAKTARIRESTKQSSSTSGGSSEKDTRLANIEATLHQLVQVQHRRAAGADSISESTSTPDAPYSAAPRAVLGPAEERDVESSMIDGLASVPGEANSIELFFGPSSTIAFLRTLSATTSTHIRQFEGIDRRIQQPFSDPLIPRMNQHSAEVPSTRPHTRDIDPLALPDELHAFHLMDKFSHGPGVLYPFLREKQIRVRFIKAVDYGQGGFTAPLLALVNAMFAIAANSGQHPPEASKSSVRESDIFYLRAQVLLEHHAQHSKPVLETVQCLILMCMYTLGTQSSLDTCDLHGRALRMAIQIGLHDPSRWHRLPLVEREIRKRTWLNCIMLDRVLSMAFGRPRYVSDRCDRYDLPLNRSRDSISADSAQNEDADQYTDDTNSVCCFSATVELYGILSNILSTIYDDNSTESISLSLAELLQHNISISTQLQTWEDGLPPNLKLTPWQDEHASEATDITFNKLSTVTRLRYLNVSMLLDRAILSHLLGANQPGSEQERGTSIHLLDVAQSNIRRLQDAAMETVTIIWKLSGRTGYLGAWWFTASFVLQACLNLLGCLLLHLDQDQVGIVILDTIVETLQRGAQAVEIIMKDSQEVMRTRKTLENLVSVADVLLAPRRKKEAEIAYSMPISSNPPIVDQSQVYAGADMPPIDWHTVFGSDCDGVFPGVNSMWLDANNFIAM